MSASVPKTAVFVTFSMNSCKTEERKIRLFRQINSMVWCIICGCEPDETNCSDEHIILNAIGGHLKSFITKIKLLLVIVKRVGPFG